MEFQYHLPVNILFGQGKSEMIGKEAARLGKRPLIVTGGNSTKASGLLDHIIEQLKREGLSYVLFDQVTPNPLTTTVYQGARLAKEEGCDFVLAVGGGSSLDAGKGIAFQSQNEGDLNQYIFGVLSSDKALPILAIPTTCGTGSEGNGFAVMTNPDTLDKKSLRCKAIIPSCSIVDPLLMTTMPRDTLITVGFDALCHNIDGYLSKISQPFTDMMALEGVALATRALRGLIEDFEDMRYWEDLCLASTFGGMVIHTAGVTALHGMEHPVSGLNNIVHGKGLAALAPAVFEATIEKAPERFQRLALAMGEGDTRFLYQLEKLLELLQLGISLRQLGIREGDLDWLVDNCQKVSEVSMRNHPVYFSKEERMQIYYKAL